MSSLTSKFINQHCPQSPVFGYCKETPDFDIQPVAHPVKDKEGKDCGAWYSGGHCKKDKETCGLYIEHINVGEVPSTGVKDKDGNTVTSGDLKKLVKKKKTAPVQGSFFEE
jgi:hypothetical protein